MQAGRAKLGHRARRASTTERGRRNAPSPPVGSACACIARRCPSCLRAQRRKRRGSARASRVTAGRRTGHAPKPISRANVYALLSSASDSEKTSSSSAAVCCGCCCCCCLRAAGGGGTTLILGAGDGVRVGGSGEGERETSRAGEREGRCRRDEVRRSVPVEPDEGAGESGMSGCGEGEASIRAGAGLWGGEGGDGQGC